jgi:uncharacterized lipoprotein YmbA
MIFIYHHRWLTIRLSMLIWMLVCGAGCDSFSKPYPDKSLYGISAGDLPQLSDGPRHEVLMVNRMRVDRQYADANFVYRTGASQFKTDYYAGFFATPDHVFGGELANWLSQSGLYSSVITAGSAADYQWSLESNITELYGDYTQNPPKAVIEAKFFLIGEAGGALAIKFQKTYRQTEPLSGLGADKLVDGWNKAYREILTSLVNDLAQVPPAESTGPRPEQH